MSRREKFIMRLPFFEDASHDTDPAYRPRALAAYTAVNIGAAATATIAEAGALLGEAPEGTEQIIAAGSGTLLVAAIISQAYVLLHWNPDKLPHKVMARRLKSLDTGFLNRARKEEEAIDAARLRAVFERIEADNRPSVVFFQSSLYLADEEEWVLETDYDAQQEMAVPD